LESRRRPRGRWLPSTKTLFRWHGWLGLNLGLVLFIVCFSGTIAVFSHEIDWLLDPALRVERRDAPYDWEAIVRGVERAYPLHRVTFVDGPRHPGFAALAYATAPDGTGVKFWVDPHTGEVRKRGSFWNVQRFFRSFHRRMFVPGGPGVALVSLFGIVLLLSVTSGFLFYRNWRRNLFRIRTSSVKAFLTDLHRQTGVWTLVFSILIVVTSAWYLLEVFAPAPPAPPPRIEEAQLRARGDVAPRRDLTELARRAEAEFPGFRVGDVLVGGGARPVEFRGQAGHWLVRDRANRVWADPSNGEILGVQRADGIGLYTRLSDTADPLHFGTFGGLWTQALWFALGLALSALMLTGAWIWNRRVRLRGVEPGEEPPPAMNRVQRGASLTLAFTILVSAAWFGRETARSYLGSDSPPAEVVRESRAGPWRVTLVALGAGRRSGGGPETLLVHVHAEGGMPLVRKAALVDGAREIKTWEEGGTWLRASLPADEGAGLRPEDLVLELEGWSGSRRDVRIAGEAGRRTVGPGVPGARPIPGPPPVPTGVWVVIGAFVLLTGGVVVAWVRIVR